MANFLKDNKSEKIRYKDKDIILYNPTKEQKQTLIEMLKDNVNVGEDLSIEGEVNIDFLRYIFKELTNIGDELNDMSDDEILECLENGNRRIEVLYREIEKLIDELAEDFQYDLEKQIKMVNGMINSIKLSKSEEDLKNKINKILKKNKINETYDDLIKKIEK